MPSYLERGYGELDSEAKEAYKSFKGFPDSIQEELIRLSKNENSNSLCGKLMFASHKTNDISAGITVQGCMIFAVSGITRNVKYS